MLNPQFWAEEGARFFAEAFTRSWWTNLTAYSYGYFDLLLRLTHQVAAALPLQAAPRFLNCTAIALQTVVPTFVLSSRCGNWMGPFPIRLVAALLYCGMPNSFETHCIELHSRVHLAVLAALVIVSPPPALRPGKLFDGLALSFSGLSGPFVVVLAPVAFWRWRQTRTPTSLRNLLILGGAFLFGVFALLFSSGHRLTVSLGVSAGNLVRVVGGQFTMGLFLGLTSYSKILLASWFPIAAGVGFAGIVLLFSFLCWRGKDESRCLCAIGFGCLAIALAAPIGATDMPQWLALWSIPGCGQRYYFIPMTMLLFALTAAAGRGRGAARWWRGVAATLLLLIAVMGVRLDWRLPAFSDLHFRRYAKRYHALPPGDSITIPINPPGWEMRLRKPPQNEH